MSMSTNLHLSGQRVATDSSIQDSGVATFRVDQGAHGSVTLFFSGTPAEQHEQINHLSAQLFTLGLHVAQKAGLFDRGAA